MAYERASDTKPVGDSLDGFIENLSKTYSRQMAIRNADDELKFNTAVLESNLTLEDQLEYRKEQLKRVSDDPEEKKRVRGEIAGLKDRIEQKKFSDQYLDQLINYQSGLSSVDSVISWLETYKTSTTDTTILNSINQQLLAKKDEKFKLTQKLMENQTQYALKDKSVEVIDSQISKVTSQKAKALLAGDETTASSLDLQIQALTKAKTENEINRDIKNFASATITGFATATKLLDSYNEKIASSSSGSPITIGDVTYSSAREFWTYKRDSYISDQSSSGFFARFANEVDTNIKTAASKNGLTTKNLTEYTAPYNSLSSRPELAGYLEKINQTKQSSMQGGANYISDTIESKYSVDYNLDKAVADLNVLKSLGINVDASLAKIMVAGANIKSNQVNSISTLAAQLMADNPKLTPEQAVAEAVKMGQGTTYSPEDLAGKSAGAVSTSALTDPSNANDPKYSVTPPAAPTSTPSAPATSSTAKSITVKSGETLSAIALRELGSASRFNEIAALNGITDPNKIQVGQVLRIPGETTTTPAPTPQNPAPAPVVTTPPQQPVAPTATSTPTPTQQPAAGYRSYTIKSGDTLSAIALRELGDAKRFGEIATLSGIQDPNKVTVGQVIKIPT